MPQIDVRLSGRRCVRQTVSDDENIGVLRERMATRLGVKVQNWGIYEAEDNKPLKLVDDSKEINQFDHKSLYFWPKMEVV